MTKAELLAYLAGVPNDEPLFLLQGSDRLAPQLVQSWHSAARHRGASEATLAAAADTVIAMRAFPRRSYPK